VKNILPQKKHTVLALVSNCDDTIGARARGIYIKQLVEVKAPFIYLFICFTSIVGCLTEMVKAPCDHDRVI